MVLAVAGIVTISLVAYLVTIYNGLIHVKNNVAKAWANIDVLLKQRHDEIPKLIKTCEAYMKYERDTLTKVIELRSSAQNAAGVSDKAVKEAALTSAVGRIFALAENYPDLKAQTSFQQLQTRISGLENQIADRREFYNESVNIYNIRIQSLPDLLVAGWMGLTAQDMFRVTGEDRKDPEINIQTPS